MGELEAPEVTPCGEAAVPELRLRLRQVCLWSLPGHVVGVKWDNAVVGQYPCLMQHAESTYLLGLCSSARKTRLLRDIFFDCPPHFRPLFLERKRTLSL